MISPGLIMKSSAPNPACVRLFTVKVEDLVLTVLSSSDRDMARISDPGITASHTDRFQQAYRLVARDIIRAGPSNLAEHRKVLF